MNHQQEHNDRLRGEFTVWLEVLIRNARTDYIRKVNRRVPTIALEDIPEHLLLAQKKPHEIAKQLHCSVQHVYNQRSLAIKKLRDLLCKGGDLL